MEISPGISIIGLGPGGSQNEALPGSQQLQAAAEVYVRTRYHPGVADIPALAGSFDVWCEQASSFAGVADQIAVEVVRLGQREQGVVYGVPGHPGVGEITVARVCDLARAAGLPVKVIPAPSFLEPALASLKLEGVANLQIVDAMAVAGLYHPPLEPGRAALIFNLHSRPMAYQLKQTLLNAYPEDFMVSLIQGAEVVSSCPLATLDTVVQPERLGIVYLSGAAPSGDFSNFQNVIAHLRAPEGCPWDQKQTHQSLRPFMLEEAYEVLEALDAGDPAAIREELGDLLLQILLHTQIATQQGMFKMPEVIDRINQKMVRRHPHVFGEVKVGSAEEVTVNWDTIKREEKAAQAQPAASILDGIPSALPALVQALTISQRAVRMGFEWPDIEGVLDKIVEEAREITEAAQPEHLESEIGDLLFTVVNLARWRQIDPESALRATNARFVRRFKQMEALAAAEGKKLEGMSIEEMDALWEQAKRLTQGPGGDQDQQGDQQ